MKTRNVAYCGIFGSLSLALPILFHVFGLAGITFLPMYWPLVTLAFLVPFRSAVLVSAIIPFVSMFLTGMPLPPMAPVISLELAIQVGLISAGRLPVRNSLAGRGNNLASNESAWKEYRKTLLLLAVVLVFGRFLHTGLVSGVAALFPALYGAKHAAITLGAFLVGWPGVVAMLIFVPVFVSGLSRRDCVCEVRFIKALRRMHLPEGVVLVSAQVLRWFEALTHDAEMLSRALELRRCKRLSSWQQGDAGSGCAPHAGGLILCENEQPKNVRDGEIIVSIRNLRVRYPGASEDALRIESLELRRGEKIALTTGNGTGKTTLLNVLAGFVGYEGEVRVFGFEPKGKGLKEIRGRIGVLFENPDDQFIYPTLREDIAHSVLSVLHNDCDVEKEVDRWLEAVGLGKGNRPISSLSRGERQRAAIAGVLAMQPDLLLLDEPSAALDAGEKARLAKLLKSLPCASIIATHEAQDK